LKKVFSEAGYSTIKKLHEHSSIFNSGNIYSAIITRWSLFYWLMKV